jgi:hypothetical protein
MEWQIWKPIFLTNLMSHPQLLGGSGVYGPISRSKRPDRAEILAFVPTKVKSQAISRNRLTARLRV